VRCIGTLIWPLEPTVRSPHLAQAVTNSPQFRVFNATTFDAELVAVRAARRAQGAGAETWRRWQGHSDIVIAIDVSRDGRWIATGSKDTTVRLWSVHQPVGGAQPHRGAARR
jgi:WD40 repeat protein